MTHAKTQRRKRIAPLFAPLRLCVIMFGFAVGCMAAAPDPDAAATVVVFNENDSASVNLAGYYAEKRGIPFDRLIGLACTHGESVSRAEYVRTIAEPLRAAFVARGWWKTELGLLSGRVEESKIRYVTLIRGIPLKISAVSNWEGDKPLATNSPLNRNEAAVDSELALLGMASKQISGSTDNPYFKSARRTAKTLPPWLLLVCRMDAAEPATVRRMIDDGLATEKNGLWGFAYVDSRGLKTGPYSEGDQWIRSVAADAANHGIPCIHDTAPTLFPANYPMSRSALYFGWYSGEMQGAFTDKSFRFVPGAVAVHLHSFSADSLRSPLRGWCAPLLEGGAAATLGNVYEPYLMLTPHLDEFARRLRTGSNFAEAAYASQSALSWMTTFIGDPLYRPFKAQSASKSIKDPAEYIAYRDGATLSAEKGRAAGEPVLQSKGRALKSGLIFEHLGLLQAEAKDFPAALKSWAQARQFYSEDADCIRCALHAVDVLRDTARPAPALALVREQIKKFPNANATARLRAIELELAPPPPSPTPSPEPANATR